MPEGRQILGVHTGTGTTVEEGPPTDDRPPRIIAGAMSGTSADGVDVALVQITGRGLGMAARLLRHHHEAYDPAVREAIFRMRQSGSTGLAELARVGRDITLAYAGAIDAALKAHDLDVDRLACLAAHGQTLFHDPPNTIQWLDPALLAAEVRCAVVSDFRRADCAVGGQGAPLVPFADYILFRHPTRDRVLLNIGGIANITYLPAGGPIDQVVAYDTGPGNCISDWVCRTYGPFGWSWDVDGQGACRGRISSDVCDRFMANPFFAAPAPKSTDGPAMIGAFAAALLGQEPEMNDLLATAAYLTGATIAKSVSAHVRTPDHQTEMIASGGGVWNKAMMGWLRSLLGSEVIIRSSDFAAPSDAKEAIAFALLGAATLDGEPSNVPSATGARRPVVLGSITPKP